jgi:hypothetical protein
VIPVYNKVVYLLFITLQFEYPVLFSSYTLTGWWHSHYTKVKQPLVVIGYSQSFINLSATNTNNSINVISADVSKAVTESSNTFSGNPETPALATVSGVSSVNATTKFVDDQDTVARDESMVAHVSPLWLQMNDSQSTEQTIIDFLSKPIVLFSSSFSTSDTFSILQSSSLPLAAFNSTQGSLWVQKLLGYFGIRMDMRIRLVVNANRFQQGRYIVGWMPLGGNSPTTSFLKSQLTNNMHMATLVQRTTVPHVELDISTQTSAELLIPFASVHNFYPLNAISPASQTAALGFINIYPYSPLVAPTGSTVASYTCYISFENVRLFGAAAAQSGLNDAEVSNKMNGPISGIATSFAKGFREFANIPLLSSYASGAAWISDRIARTASIFGFSKPTQGDSITKMQILNNPSHSCVDGDADVRPLSFLAKPSTVPIKGFSGTELDEMDFSYIARKFAWFQTVNWTTASSGVVTSMTVVPNKAASLGGAFHHQPVSFVSGFFGLWRGSLKFRFKFVKTEFHSGRLQFCFYPGDDLQFLSGTPQYVNRIIVDLREHIEVEITIPYISRYPYMHIGTHIGNLTIEVVDALVAPASVSTIVPILCEIAGGDDFEVAMPWVFNGTPTIFSPQSGISAPQKVVSMNIGNSIVTADPTTSAAFAIGDKVSSFRAYLKRYTPVSPSSKNPIVVGRANSANLTVVPDYIPIVPASGAANGYANCDVLGMVAMCYAFWGGGIRIKDVISAGVTPTPGNIVNSNCFIATFIPLISGTHNQMFSDPGNTAISVNNHQVLQQAFNNNTVSIELPQYTRALKRCVADIWGASTVTATSYLEYQRAGGTQGVVVFATPEGLGDPVNTTPYDLHNIYRSASDDLDLSLFISVPPIVGNSSTSLYNIF